MDEEEKLSFGEILGGYFYRKIRYRRLLGEKLSKRGGLFLGF